MSEQIIVAGLDGSGAVRPLPDAQPLAVRMLDGSSLDIVLRASSIIPSAPSATLNIARSDRTVTAWLSAITGTPVPQPAALTLFTANGGNVIPSVTGAGTLADPWTYVAPGAGAVEIDVAASLSNGVLPNWTGAASIEVPADVLEQFFELRDGDVFMIAPSPPLSFTFVLRPEGVFMEAA